MCHGVMWGHLKKIEFRTLEALRSCRGRVWKLKPRTRKRRVGKRILGKYRWELENGDSEIKIGGSWRRRTLTDNGNRKLYRI